MWIGFRDSTITEILTPEEVLQSDYLTQHVPQGTMKQILLAEPAMAQWVEPFSTEKVDQLFEHGITDMDDPLVVVEWMTKHKAELTTARIQYFTFIGDATLRLVIQFLRLHTPDLSELPSLLRAQDTKLAGFKPFMDWIAPLSLDQLLPLCFASMSLGIKNLDILCGYRLSECMREMDESAVRRTLNVPEKFRDATLEKLRELLHNHEWLHQYAV